jgi:hypothetical protein
MKIEETENAYDMHVTEQELEDRTPVVEFYQENGSGVESFIGIDKHQAEQLIKVLQCWVNGEEVE